jgi:type II secretory pathway pseudopilin PulG
MPARLFSNGFAIMYIVIGVAVSILLITTGVVLANSPAKQAQSLDNQRQLDLTVIQHALDEYAGNHNGQYPTTAISPDFAQFDNHQPQCFECGLADYQQNGVTDVPFTKDNWIPDLVDQGYLPTLPLDPQTGLAHAGLCQASGWPRGYIYFSNGQDYKLLAYCTPTSDLNVSAGPVSPYCVSADQHLLPNPVGHPQLATMADPKQPSFHYAIYSPGWACL